MTSQNYNLSDIFPKFVTFYFYFTCRWLSVVVVLVVFIYFADCLCYGKIRFSCLLCCCFVCLFFGWLTIYLYIFFSTMSYWVVLFYCHTGQEINRKLTKYETCAKCTGFVFCNFPVVVRIY